MSHRGVQGLTNAGEPQRAPAEPAPYSLAGAQRWDNTKFHGRRRTSDYPAKGPTS
jgi:hypothetical protein